MRTTDMDSTKQELEAAREKLGDVATKWWDHPPDDRTQEELQSSRGNLRKSLTQAKLRATFIRAAGNEAAIMKEEEAKMLEEKKHEEQEDLDSLTEARLATLRVYSALEKQKNEGGKWATAKVHQLEARWVACKAAEEEIEGKVHEVEEQEKVLKADIDSNEKVAQAAKEKGLQQRRRARFSRRSTRRSLST